MDRIGRYKIVGELGRGAMGVVYRAEDPAIGRTVAIKTIRLADLTDEGERGRLRERLFREARSAGILSHPGIVTIYDIAEENNMAYVFMEFVEGTTLEQMMSADNPLDREVIIETLRQTATALDYAHSKGIIHRDIKPANIMVSVDGQAKVTDFGVARIVSQQMTQAGTIMGTPNYMSPEQVQGSPVDGRADQFSLAVIAFELLTGEKPYAADTLPTLLYRIAREQPAPPRRLNPTLGPQVDSVLERAFSKQPASRFRTCTEFVSSLAVAVNASPGWQPMKRGSVQALDTVVTSSGSHPATVVEAPPEEPPVSEPPLPEPPKPPPQVAVPVARPPRAARRERDEEPGPAAGKWALVAVFAILAVAAGVLGYRKFVVPPEEGRAAREAAGVPSAPTPAQTPPEAPTKPAPARDRSAEAASEALPPPPRVEPKVEPAPPVQPAAATPKPRTETAAPVASGTHSVQIRTDPPGAVVVADRDPELTCRTPCELSLAAGRHVLTFTMAGHRLFPRIIQVPADTDVTVTLDRMSGTLAVSSTPAGATIILNGERRAEKTPAMITLPAGKYSIVLMIEGRAPFEDQVEVRDQVMTRVGVDW
ncbi:MAG: protein kinase [Bryobacteraceae bacterium]|nr:protein kinase [Bryobacteraceae bacterium]